MSVKQTSAYHHQGNGQVERFNRTVEAILAKHVKENQRDWDSCLPKAYRTSIQECTGFTPFHLFFERSPKLPVDVMVGRVEENTANNYPDFVQDLHHSLLSLTRQRLSAAHHQQKTGYDHRSTGLDFKVGDCVWLYIPAAAVERTKKFSSLWRGPSTVIDMTSPVNYRIQLIGTAVSTVVH